MFLKSKKIPESKISLKVVSESNWDVQKWSGENIVLFLKNTDGEGGVVNRLDHGMEAGSEMKADGPLTLAASERAQGCPIHQ